MVEITAGFIVNILIIAVSFVVLNWASNLTINNALKIASITQLGKTAVGFSLIAFSTSLPELTVAVIAAFSGGAALSVGNVLGSNIVNICVVVGLAAVLVYLKFGIKRRSPEINVIPNFAKSELSTINFGVFISSIIPLFLLYVKAPTWLVGFVLIAIFVGYMYQLSKVRMPTDNQNQEDKTKLTRYIIFTLVGIFGVVGSAYFLVESAVAIAQTVGIPQTIIGATIVAIGTSLPELTLDLKAFLRGHSGLAFGDIIGSNFVNITLILGVSLFVPALIGSPVTMDLNVFGNLVTFSIISNLFFWYFLSREKIGWKEGVVFLIIYGLFIATTLGLV
jgi:cation:H+ antiporter